MSSRAAGSCDDSLSWRYAGYAQIVAKLRRTARGLDARSPCEARGGCEARRVRLVPTMKANIPTWGK
jgi:hypothetical protein